MIEVLGVLIFDLKIRVCPRIFWSNCQKQGPPGAPDAHQSGGVKTKGALKVVVPVSMAGKNPAVHLFHRAADHGVGSQGVFEQRTRRSPGRWPPPSDSPPACRADRRFASTRFHSRTGCPAHTGAPPPAATRCCGRRRLIRRIPTRRFRSPAPSPSAKTQIGDTRDGHRVVGQ